MLYGFRSTAGETVSQTPGVHCVQQARLSAQLICRWVGILVGYSVCSACGAGFFLFRLAVIGHWPLALAVYRSHELLLVMSTELLIKHKQQV